MQKYREIEQDMTHNPCMEEMTEKREAVLVQLMCNCEKVVVCAQLTTCLIARWSVYLSFGVHSDSQILGVKSLPPHLT